MFVSSDSALNIPVEMVHYGVTKLAQIGLARGLAESFPAFQRDPTDGHFLWPGYRDNLRALLWLIRRGNGEAQGVSTPVGVLPAKQELDLDGLIVDDADLDSSASTWTAGGRRWDSARRTWLNSAGYPKKYGKHTVV